MTDSATPRGSADDGPLVSVAVVTYNHGYFLEECLDSILAQDYPNVEIVVADDGSKDGTAELLERYDSSHPDKFNILISKQNQGVTPNHNLALSGCRGKYIAWIGGDDLMLPGKLSAQVAFLEANPQCAICYHDVEVFESDSGEILYRASEMDPQTSGNFATLVRKGNFHRAISSMVRRSASPESFNPSIPVASDWLYFVECLAGGGTIEPIPGILGRYRRHARSVTHSADPAPPPKLMVEHLQSCAIILGRWPAVTRHARFRMSRLLVMQRWDEGGAHYRAYLKASLGMHFSLKVAAAYVANLLFGIRR